MEGEKQGSVEDRLGPVVLNCRARTLRHWLSGQGFGPLYFYVALPGIIAFFALWLAAPGILLMEERPPSIARPVLISWYVVSCILLAFAVYITPRWDYLVLHERGFRCRITFKRRTILFEELSGVFYGRPQGKLEQLLHSGLRFANPSVVTWGSNMSDTALTIFYNENSKPDVFKTFFIRFELADITEFCDYIVANYPRLSEQA
jgi:hypothetical protein